MPRYLSDTSYILDFYNSLTKHIVGQPCVEWSGHRPRWVVSLHARFDCIIVATSAVCQPPSHCSHLNWSATTSHPTAMCDSVRCSGCTGAACSAQVRTEQLSLVHPGLLGTLRAQEIYSSYVFYVSLYRVFVAMKGHWLKVSVLWCDYSVFQALHNVLIWSKAA